MLGCYLELDIFIPIFLNFFFYYSHSVHYKLGVVKGVINPLAPEFPFKF